MKEKELLVRGVDYGKDEDSAQVSPLLLSQKTIAPFTHNYYFNPDWNPDYFFLRVNG